MLTATDPQFVRRNTSINENMPFYLVGARSRWYQTILMRSVDTMGR